MQRQPHDNQDSPPPYADANAPQPANAPHISLSQTRYFMTQFCNEEKLNNIAILSLLQELESDLLTLKQQFSQLPTPIILTSAMINELMNLSSQTVMNMLQHKDFDASTERERLAKELQKAFNSRLHLSEISSLNRKNIFWELLDFIIRTAVTYAGMFGAIAGAICMGAPLGTALLPLVLTVFIFSAPVLLPLALIVAASCPAIYSSNKTTPLTPINQKIETIQSYPMTFFNKINEHLKPAPLVERAYVPSFVQPQR